MASMTVCCATSAVAAAPAASAASSCTSSRASSVSFAKGCTLKGVKVYGHRQSISVANLEKGFRRLSVRAEDGAEVEEEAVKPHSAGSSPGSKRKARVSVKAPRRQRVTLRFLWLEKNIGIALDQVVPGHGTIPLSPYFFWPRKDAWEELKAKLDSKKWISRKRTIILLNQATDIINLWQQNASNSL
ncbi:30S ribosomal protein 3 [Marchantia polymorpha subsp. ruderalis]|uniref:30S ribosomal protein 3, chloroplastic n=2 Tax=Marchantia polymorpha TaxID=3197 RepID=A0A176VRD9_MARPO|nr:hypothetical protein AXG93_731s1180 [Marchantia polymorpha subsp. ruderalis]PTQ43119.1 hypothetical protein MARPO_0026s0019 [Marchantia polymorpha]BBN02199.1 hypothetical protein Mp_2g13520 [Marchantia polymorpha subsp. ruderalis]|eukprot:PTQ43119.1 hypothetical protein MARPO_0026s0019 [Marchantia polymorpha]